MNKTQNESYKVGVLIPTYNNAKTLQKVVDGVLSYFKPEDIIIVNDGSTDATAQVLSNYKTVHQIHFERNKGKGIGLRVGFHKAKTLGFTHIISIDSDGQHFPDDLPRFLSAMQQDTSALFIGARNMSQSDVPSKSSFGNKFSNFWFWFETEIKLSDTQSGYRLYPIYKMPSKWFSTKFEFEIECIVRAAWRGIRVQNIPIQIKYENADRVSHFRPFIDFTRISILNTVLVFIAIFYIWPRNFFLRYKKKGWKKFIAEDILGSHDSPKTKALSLALGAFIGIIPIWGFQTVAVLFLAVVLKLNKALAFAASNISIPPLIPLIVLAALQIGGFLFQIDISTKNITTFAGIGEQMLAYIVGSFILATVSALFVGLLSYFVLKIVEKKKP